MRVTSWEKEEVRRKKADRGKECLPLLPSSQSGEAHL